MNTIVKLAIFALLVGLAGLYGTATAKAWEVQEIRLSADGASTESRDARLERILGIYCTKKFDALVIGSLIQHKREYKRAARAYGCELKHELVARADPNPVSYVRVLPHLGPRWVLIMEIREIREKKENPTSPPKIYGRTL